MYPNPNVGPLMGNPYKNRPKKGGVFMGYNSPRIPRTRHNYHGYTQVVPWVGTPRSSCRFCRRSWSLLPLRPVTGSVNRLFVPPFRSMLNCWYAAIHWFMPWFMAFWCRIGDCSIVKPNKILWFNYPLPTATFNCSVSGAPTQDASGEWRFVGKPKPKEKMPSSWWWLESWVGGL